MCEVLNADGTPTNPMVTTIDDDDDDFWFGFEQEYFLWDPDQTTTRFPRDQTPQGQFYCSVGGANAFGREIIEDHLNLC